MNISTTVDLQLLRRYAELGHWTAATNSYFDACLQGIDADSREELHEAVWARDSRAVAAVVGRLAGAPSPNLQRVKPVDGAIARPE